MQPQTNPFGDEPVTANPFGDEPIEESSSEFIQQRANPNRGRTPLEAFAIAAGRGMTNLGRGIGLVSPENPRTTSSFQQLQNAYPAATTTGEIAGEVAPFLLPGVGVSGIAPQGVRVVASGLLGALEGAMIARGKGANATDTLQTGAISGIAAGSMEALFPIASRLAGQLYRRVRGAEPRGPLFDRSGNPTPELGEILDETGVTLDALSDRAIDILEGAPAGARPDQVARQARFAEAGIEPTRGDITQNFANQADEARLESMASGPTGEPLRQRRLQQSQAFEEGINAMVDSLGVPAETGAKVKDALKGRLADLTKQKNDLYKSIAEISPHVAEMPLFTDEILKAMPSPADLRRASRLQGNNVEALKEIMVEFGIDQTPEAAEAFVKSGGEIIPLNVGNFEEFRQALNQLRGGASPGERRTAQFVTDIINSLDGEVDLVDDALKNANITDESIVESVKQARGIVRGIKTEFSPDDLVGRLIGKKADGITPTLEASQIIPTLTAKGTPIEKVQRVVKSLTQAGDDGRKALGDIQASVILSALNDASRAPTRKTSGLQTIAYSQFFNSLNRVGDDKLKVLFSSNPNALAQLNNFREVARDLSPNAAATPKGSAPVILDLVNRFSQLPGLAVVRDMVNLVIKAGADDRALRQAFDAQPEIAAAASELQKNFPALASSLGIAVALNLEDEDG